MNENENNLRRQTVAEAIFGIIFIFAVLIFILYRFGTSKDNVTNTDTEENTVTKEELAESLDDTGGQNEIYFKYIKKIYDEQSLNGKDANVDSIVSDYQSELASKTALPEQNIVLTSVSANFSKAQYNADFENAFTQLKSVGGTSESKIFNSQIVDETTLIPLSDYDKETILRIATEYEKFGNVVVGLNTPKVYTIRASNIAKDAFNVAYILRQMVKVEDKQVYTLWITKYSQVMFDIIASRYAQ